MGVEPTTSAWEANVLPINYIRILFCNNIITQNGDYVKGFLQALR